MSLTRLFIGSSTEQKVVAASLKLALDKARRASGVELECDVWYRQFEPTWLTLEVLEKALGANDYGVFIFAPDDVVISRKRRTPAVRDNVLFEFGLWMGRYGRGRCVVVAPEGAGLRIPSDLAALGYIQYSPPEDRTSIDGWERQLTEPAIEILKAVQKYGATPEALRNTDVSIGPSSVPGITQAYRSVADARHDIITEIRRLGARPNSAPFSVRIIGNRLREIWSLLNEVVDGAVSDVNPAPITNVEFTIYHTDPEFLSAIEAPIHLDADRQRRFVDLMAEYADIIRRNIVKLQSYNHDPAVRAAGLVCRTVSVKSLPNHCAYILGEEIVYLGKFLWDPDTGDFGVRRTSCFRIERGCGPADRFIEWCLNEANQHELWGR